MTFTHADQQEIWEKEHLSPTALLQMDSQKGSSCLPVFFDFLQVSCGLNLSGIEMGCGKGRNLIWLAQQSKEIRLTGFDFSATAIEVARKRAGEKGLEDRISFYVKDATLAWGFDLGSFDFGIDCTATTDIECPQARKKAVANMHGAIKKGGYLLVYVMSDADAYHLEMIRQSPAKEPYAFHHPLTGKFEKVFTAVELDELYSDFRCIEQRRMVKPVVFHSREYTCYHHLRIYQK